MRKGNLRTRREAYGREEEKLFNIQSVFNINSEEKLVFHVVFKSVLSPYLLSTMIRQIKLYVVFNAVLSHYA